MTQGIFMGTCDELNFFERTIAPNNAALGMVLDLLNPVQVSTIPGAKPLGATGQYSCPTTR